MAKTQAAKPATRTRAAKPVPALAAAAKTLAAATPAPAPAKPATVALRGGPAVTTIKLTGNPYRTGAVHNAAWWKTLSDKLAKGPQPVAPLLGDGTNGTVPAHFVGYALRRGYLASV